MVVALPSSAGLLCAVLGALRVGIVPVLLNATLLDTERDALVADGIELTRHYVYMSGRVFYCVIIQPTLQDLFAVAQLCAVRCGRSACPLTHMRRPAARACHAT